MSKISTRNKPVSSIAGKRQNEPDPSDDQTPTTSKRAKAMAAAAAEDSDFEVEINQAQPKAAAKVTPKSIRKTKLKNAADQESDFELDEPTGDIQIEAIDQELDSINITGVVFEIYPAASKTNHLLNKITVVVAQGEHRIQVDLWNDRKKEVKKVGLKIGQVIKLTNVRSVMTEPGKEIYNHGTTAYQLKLAWQSKIEIFGDSDEFEPIYTKLIALDKETHENRVINVKGIPVQRSKLLTYSADTKLQIISLGQGKNSIDLKFWNALTPVANSIHLKKATFIHNVQVKTFKEDMYLNWTEFSSFDQVD